MSEAIVVSGCQRSGTTLLNLVFDSHPRIRGIEETHFRRHFTLAKLQAALDDPAAASVLSFKLPMQSHMLDAIVDALPGRTRVVWLVRDPRAVVASMVNLHLKVSPFVSVSWAASFIHKEIINALQFVPQPWLDPLEAEIHRFRLIENIPSVLRPAEDIWFTAALCWRLKQLELDWQRDAGLECPVVKYEDLVTRPEPTLRTLFETLEIDWDDAVLHHHEHATGGAIGGTRRDRPISATGLENWKESLPEPALPVIAGVCAEAAGAWGYDL